GAAGRRLALCAGQPGAGPGSGRGPPAALAGGAGPGDRDLRPDRRPRLPQRAGRRGSAGGGGGGAGCAEPGGVVPPLLRDGDRVRAGAGGADAAGGPSDRDQHRRRTAKRRRGGAGERARAGNESVPGLRAGPGADRTAGGDRGGPLGGGRDRLLGGAGRLHRGPRPWHFHHQRADARPVRGAVGRGDPHHPHGVAGGVGPRVGRARPDTAHRV
ncbi:MAG: hypothetical protein AVDCRST_MAG19-968, partial [uncultured Thermomicrobiales bacterium]